MSYDKLMRGRRILGSINSMVRDRYGRKADHYNADEIYSIDMSGLWSATITRRSSSADADRPLPRECWDFLHVHVGKQIVLALRFAGLEAELIQYIPGHWERWFGTYNLADDRPILANP